jgi:hypothetical protein
VRVRQVAPGPFGGTTARQQGLKALTPPDAMGAISEGSCSSDFSGSILSPSSEVMRPEAAYTMSELCSLKASIPSSYFTDHKIWGTKPLICRASGLCP